ncbi:MAG: tetratricopeptide repeat protein [Saprospirales bacterium]|nr:tetratricopeptide repeat protein [Saprospirales bacterium]
MSKPKIPGQHLMVLPTTDERYPSVSKLASNLTDIAKNLEVIQLQDSLLTLSQMSEEERFAVATEIKKAQDEARRKALLESAKNELARPGVIGNNGGPKAGGLKSDFFAYDDRAVKRGIKEFERKWGNRPLEDNWRRRSTSFAVNTGEEENASQESGSSGLTKEEADAIFRDVPKTPEDIEAADKKIMEALFALGRLYREKLDNEVRAIAALEELLDRYPETNYRPEALYLLYLAYTDSGKPSDAKRYYDLLTAEFPDSPYAQMLTDPDFLRKTKDREQRINQYYNEVYAVFQRGQYRDAFEQIKKAPDMFGGNNSHTPRFELLKAMCLGNMEGKGAYVAALKDLIERFPNAPEQKQARELLRLLGEYTASGPGGTTLKPEEETYVFEPEDKHYIIVVFKGNIALETAKVEMSDYHLKYHKLDKLRVSNIYLGEIDDRTPIVVVRSFDNSNKAMEYLQGVEANKTDFLTAEFDYQVFPISQNNYRQMLKNKVIDGYPEFFKKNY